MDNKLAIVAVFVVSIMTASVIVMNQSGPEQDDDRIYQIGTLDGLINADYEGKVSVGYLLSHGSYGLGTFEGMDGEMIVIDGECYRAANDGSVSEVDESSMTPFASVAFFDQDGVAITIDDAINYTGFQEQVLSQLSNDETFYLIVIHATFSNVTVRSVPGQVEPYPPLANVLEDQSVYYLTNVTGTLIGFYSPSYIGTIDSSGFHFHFISDDRTQGGHVLDLQLENVEVQLDMKMGVDLELIK